MSGDKTAFAAELKVLADRLSACRQVTQYDTPQEKQAWTLAHDLMDLAGSFQRFLEVQLPRLRDGELDSDQLNAALLDIGEEFRHILYHIRDAEFFAYLRE